MSLVKEVAPALAAALIVGPRTRRGLCSELGISTATFARATELVRDRGLWLEVFRVSDGAVWRATAPDIRPIGLGELVKSDTVHAGEAAMLAAEHLAKLGRRPGTEVVW